MPKDPIRVLVTGAAGQLAYSLIPIIAKGHVFGDDQPVILHLLELPRMMSVLNGVVMELVDGAYPLLQEVIATDEEKTAFTGIDVAFLVGSMPRKPGMDRRDLLTANAKIYQSNGHALDQYAKKSVKVLVVGNPANTNALICSKYAPSIPTVNISAMTRLDHNRAQAQIALKLKVSSSDVRNVIIWGNHSSTQLPDVSHAFVNVGGRNVRVADAINDDGYIQGEFLSGHWVSMAVLSDGSYGSPADVMFSYPVYIDSQRQWRIVDGLSMSDFVRQKIQATGKELVEERNEALAFCKE
ncbi:malate dehydrogenase, cytoplasmic-like isoform X2 [Dermacentor andersoni]|uniref:malate dehydrogenase, cytoplasmic-like isoform X2 n=1 Tax=Dermacentor andersoni TaxID=34620 RepID=UPI0021557EEB|nr:malate dehydrogenase, cytoplasmic-like isoform X2 [Dermacentor andersoni]